MKKFTVFITFLLIIAFTCGVAAEKAFYWYDMMERPQLKYRPAHGMLSYYLQPIEFAGTRPLTDEYAQQLEITFGLSSSAEITGHFYSTNDSKIWSGTLKTRIVDTKNLILSIRGGFEQYSYETPVYGENHSVTDVAVISQLNLTKSFKIHNNAELAIISGGLMQQRLENGFTFYMNPYNSLQANFNSVFSNDTQVYSIEGAYKLIVNPQMNFVLYLTKRIQNPSLHCENIIEFHPTRAFTLKGNLIYNTGTVIPDVLTYQSNWIAFKAEQAFTNFSVFADFLHEIDVTGYGGLKFGINVKL